MLGLAGLEFFLNLLLEVAMKRFQLKTVFCLSLVVLFPGAGHAVDLFGVDVTYSGGTISQSASSLPDLIEAVVRNQDAFLPLVGNDFTGSLTYFGIPAAVSVAVVGDTQLTLTSPLTGLSRVFTGVDRNDLENQLSNWLLEEGGSEVAKLLKEAAKRSTAAITDGNPSSTTARMADRAFRTFGLFNAGPVMRGSGSRVTSGIWINGGKYEADTPSGTAEGSEIELNLPWWFNFGKRVSLIGNTNGQYKDIEGTEIYGAGMDLGLGIRLVVRDEVNRFGWQVTPYAGLQGIGSYDGATAGLMDQFGITNRFEFELRENVLLVIANQFSFFDSLKIEIQGVSIDPELEQQILKNGVMLDFPFPGSSRVYLNGFLVDSRFLEDVVIDNYQTVGGGLSVRGKSKTLNIYVSRDIATDYSGWNAGLGLAYGH